MSPAPGQPPGGWTGPAAAGPGAPAPAPDPRPDATQATLLSLRWELEQTREELRKALGRPVDELERELAELRARLGVQASDDGRDARDAKDPAEPA